MCASGCFVCIVLVCLLCVSIACTYCGGVRAVVFLVLCVCVRCVCPLSGTIAGVCVWWFCLCRVCVHLSSVRPQFLGGLFTPGLLRVPTAPAGLGGRRPAMSPARDVK